MNTTKTLVMTGLMILAGTAAHADEVVLAWQEPGFVMEEIVVTAKRPTNVVPETKDAQRPEIQELCL